MILDMPLEQFFAAFHDPDAPKAGQSGRRWHTPTPTVAEMDRIFAERQVRRQANG